MNYYTEQLNICKENKIDLWVARVANAVTDNLASPLPQEEFEKLCSTVDEVALKAEELSLETVAEGVVKLYYEDADKLYSMSPRQVLFQLILRA